MTNKNKELFNKNLELSHEFSKYLLNHLEIEDKIPPDASIVFIVDDDPELSQQNIRMSRNQRQRNPNQPIIFVRTKGLKPLEALEESRLIEPHLEKAIA